MKQEDSLQLVDKQSQQLYRIDKIINAPNVVVIMAF